MAVAANTLTGSVALINLRPLAFCPRMTFKIANIMHRVVAAVREQDGESMSPFRFPTLGQ